MPIYEFSCPECGHKFELKFNIKDIVDLTRCPKCEKFARRIPSKFNHYWKVAI